MFNGIQAFNGIRSVSRAFAVLWRVVDCIRHHNKNIVMVHDEMFFSSSFHDDENLIKYILSTLELPMYPKNGYTGH